MSSRRVHVRVHPMARLKRPRLKRQRLKRKGVTTAVGAVAAAASVLALVSIAGARPAPASGGVAAADGTAVNDDTAFLQSALDELEPGGTLTLEPRTYRHSKVLTVRVPDVHIKGSGATLLATNEKQSAFHIAADSVVVSDLVLGIEETTKRWEGYDQHKLTITKAKKVEVRSVKVTGSAAAGVYVGAGASEFLLEDVLVYDTRADGIHMTGGAHDGTVRNPTVMRSGDDGVAVVSYESDEAPCRNITVYAPVVEDNSHGRGVSVVGGDGITYHDVQIRGSSSAGVYIGVEGAPYFTRSSRDVLISGGQVSDANHDESVDHGAVLVYSARKGNDVSDVRIENVAIENNRDTATWQVGLLHDGGTVDNIVFSRLVLQEAKPDPFYTDVDASRYKIQDWLVAGKPFNG